MGGGPAGAGAAATGSRRTAVDNLLRMAAAAREHGRHDEAASCCQDVLRMDEGNAEAMSGIGLAFVGLGRHDEAASCFRTVLESDPNDPVALAGMGDLCMRLVEFERAVEFYDRAIAADPDRSGPHVGRGTALESLGRYDEAAESLGAALRLGGDDADALYMLAECEFAAGRPRDALHFFGRAYGMSAGAAGVAAAAMHNMGGCLSALGRHGEAISCFEKALGHDESDWDSAVGIGCSLAAMGKSEAALVQFDSLAEDGPDEIALQALLHKSRILEAAGRGDEAIAACDMAVELDECNAAALLRKGRILARSGRRLAALSCAAAARHGNPGHRDAARDAAAVARSLERDGKLPWMAPAPGGRPCKGPGGASGPGRAPQRRRRRQEARRPGGGRGAGAAPKTRGAGGRGS